MLIFRFDLIKKVFIPILHSDDEKEANPMVSGYQNELDPEDTVSDTENVILTGDIAIEPLRKPLTTENKDNESEKNSSENIAAATADSSSYKLINEKVALTVVPEELKSIKKETVKNKKPKEKTKVNTKKKSSKKKSIHSEEDEDRKKLEEFLGPESDLSFVNRASEEYESL